MKLSQMIDTLEGDNPFIGDSSSDDYKQNFGQFMDKLKACKEGKMQFSLVFKDPLANCFIQNPYHPEIDPIVTVEEYVRSEEENDELGLTHMQV